MFGESSKCFQKENSVSKLPCCKHCLGNCRIRGSSHLVKLHIFVLHVLKKPHFLLSFIKQSMPLELHPSPHHVTPIMRSKSSAKITNII